MSKIRINELARELEVKPGVILDLLPELGVSDKKTHSSSLDDDVALQIRQALVGKGEGTGRPREADAGEKAPEPATGREVAYAPVAAPPAPAAAAPPLPPPSQAAPKETPTPSSVVSTVVTAPPPQEEKEREAPAPVRPPVAPVRPPLAAGKPSVPSIPIPPRPAVLPKAIRPPLSAGAVAQAPPVAPPTPPLTARPGAPATPASPAAPVSTAPPASETTRRPGQILSGPRQPLPASMTSAPGEPTRPALGQPAPPMPGPARPAAPRPPLVPRAPIAPRPERAPGPAAPAAAGPRAGLAGQPAPRPVVPPRPDLVAKLQQTQRSAAPGQPAPRPGAPRATPVPGRPIYDFRGPVRPGQPSPQRGPGMPSPGGPGGARPMRGRGMHPTAPLPEPPTAATPDRRHQGKPGRKPAVDREAEREGKHQPMYRRQEAEVQAANTEITISEGITVKELAEKLGLKANVVIQRMLTRKKMFVTINQTLDTKLAEEIAEGFGALTNKVSYEEETTQDVDLAEVAADMVRRAPVVTVMGHVDHGKTSLLDAIRLANVADREAGGITQHIGAYQAIHNGQKIVFIDTPGHEAFTRMRARGAKVTDIVILVVAADDGVMPQTREAIDHAKAAGAPLIVAINKIDKPDAQIDRIKQQLSDLGLLAEDWGGDTVMVPVSAKTKQNLDLLLEMVLLVAEMQNLKANPARPALCTVLEAQLDRGRGPVATVLVRNGTLRVGDFFICGTVFGKVRALFDDHGEPVREAEPSTPVEVLGLEDMPEVGDTLQVVTDTAKAKQIVGYRETREREQMMAKSRITLESLHQQLREGETKELNVIIKADVGGSAEVLTETLQKLSTEKVKIRVIHAGVGAIRENDVQLAAASDGIVIGFNVRPERSAAALAEQEKVDLRLHTIIYDLTQEIRKAMAGLLEPVIREVYLGRAEVRDTFRITKVGTVAGCYVQDGLIKRGADMRLLRDNIVIHTGKIEGLRRFKDDASEVKQGFECGINIAHYNDVKPGDVIEAFTQEKIAADL
ncbi:MAG: translation initiation factor IF-2 [Bryobacterales bacterium]|nr:translation initiation factor IF-2 [Bryobacterales bacterium]